jgi:hypothetical protein
MYNDDIDTATMTGYDDDDKGYSTMDLYLQYTAEEAIKANLMALDWEESDAGVLTSEIFIDDESSFYIIIGKKQAEMLHKKFYKGFEDAML